MLYKYSAETSIHVHFFYSCNNSKAWILLQAWRQLAWSRMHHPNSAAPIRWQEYCSCPMLKLLSPSRCGMMDLTNAVALTITMVRTSCFYVCTLYCMSWDNTPTVELSELKFLCLDEILPKTKQGCQFSFFQGCAFTPFLIFCGEFSSPVHYLRGYHSVFRAANLSQDSSITKSYF